MHTINLIASAIANDPERVAYTGKTTQGVCAVTGKHDICVPRKDLLGKSFTNGDLLAAPESDLVSLDAYHALTYKWERASSWYCDGERFVRLDRKAVRAMVLAAQYGKQWSGYATTSYKKHGSLFTKVNTSNCPPLEGEGGGKSPLEKGEAGGCKSPLSRGDLGVCLRPGKAIWRFEMRDADCTDHGQLMAIWDRLNSELRGGIGRSVLESLDCPPFLVKKLGLSRWVDFYRWAFPLYQGGIYQFLCYLLPSQEQLKLEGCDIAGRQ